MKLWGFGKLNKNKSDDHPLERSGGAISDYERIWILVCTTFNQILPRTDLYLCVNEHGEIALIALPDLPVSMTLGKIIYEHPRPSVVFVQRVQQGEDTSYLAPITYTDKQTSILSSITPYFSRGELNQGLKKQNWPKVIYEVRSSNSSYLDDASYRQRINRVKIHDNANPVEPDDFQSLQGYAREVPVFLYTEPDIKREISRQELQREIFVRQLLSEGNIDAVRNTLRTEPGWEHLHENDVLVHVINRVETELKLYSRVLQPSFADIMLNPAMSEFIPGPPPSLKFTPAAVQASEKAESCRELAFSITNWRESNIVQVALHVNKFKGQPLKDSVTSPAITIFQDEMGIHTLQAWLFRICTDTYSLGMETAEPVDLDAVPASQIPEISWKLISEETTSEWWQTDTIVKKVLWLATYNLASHLVGDPVEVVCSVTPIGYNVIQIAMLFDNLEAGAPYAFAIVRDDFTVKAIPVFPTGIYKHHPDGSRTSTQLMYLKNYTITRQGKRILDSEQIRLFEKPIYSAIISGMHLENG